MLLAGTALLLLPATPEEDVGGEEAAAEKREGGREEEEALTGASDHVLQYATRPPRLAWQTGRAARHYLLLLTHACEEGPARLRELVRPRLCAINSTREQAFHRPSAAFV